MKLMMMMMMMMMIVGCPNPEMHINARPSILYGKLRLSNLEQTKRTVNQQKSTNVSRFMENLLLLLG